MNKNDLPEDQVKVIMSICPKCKNPVRVAVEHKMDKKEFYKEVTKYNLDVETISLIDFRKKEFEFCGCKNT